MTMTRILARTARAAALSVGLAALTGCAALSSLDDATRSLPTYELRPASFGAAPAARSSRTLLLAPPTSSAALASDRVMIRPSTLLVEYLPDARWADAAPTHFQELLSASISNTGAVAHVGTDVAGPLPDFVVLSEVQAFQAELTGPDLSPPARVRIRVRLTIVRDMDRGMVGSRVFEQVADSPDLGTPTLMLAFDAAMNALLRDAAAWVVASTGGRVS
jgi:cholesterol transport system auxiliary component